ncbi:hypothetical protein [Microcoleus sp. herbarium12]
MNRAEVGEHSDYISRAWARSTIIYDGAISLFGRSYFFPTLFLLHL